MRDPGAALELETRKRIYQHLLRVPGDHMREIGRALDIRMGTLEYHLHYLVKAGILVTREDPRYTRYFPAGGLDRREKDVLALLRQEMPRRIATFLLLNPGANHGRILEEFTVSASTLSFHLKKLTGSGLCLQEKVGRENRYRVVDEGLVGRVLVKHRESFLDAVVDRFAGVWLALDASPRAVRPEEEPASDADGDEPGKDARDDRRGGLGE